MTQFWFVVDARDDATREWRKLFGERLRALREERSLTQEQLADCAKVDRKLIYRTELAQTSPRLDVVYRIALALDVPVAGLCDVKAN